MQYVKKIALYFTLFSHSIKRTSVRELSELQFSSVKMLAPVQGSCKDISGFKTRDLILNVSPFCWLNLLR